ncbi:hypothetical protein VHUM_00251 [Vanrija humicola]|uniref:Uncharacterized protein n=1 Tax=Vanrija humicola TaxID=5417 RepID=A0A7D8V5Y4_VANHU|nr:hypothetical protein VHUM_00251 [Vanrija humicola]
MFKSRSSTRSGHPPCWATNASTRRSARATSVAPSTSSFRSTDPDTSVVSPRCSRPSTRRSRPPSGPRTSGRVSSRSAGSLCATCRPLPSATFVSPTPPSASPSQTRVTRRSCRTRPAARCSRSSSTTSTSPRRVCCRTLPTTRD